MLRSNSKQYFVRYDFNRLAVYLSFRTPMGGSFPHFPPLWRRHWPAVSYLATNLMVCSARKSVCSYAADRPVAAATRTCRLLQLLIAEAARQHGNVPRPRRVGNGVV